MSTWIFLKHYSKVLQAWAVIQPAFNYGILTLMVTFLVYLTGLDTWASIKGMRRVEGRSHCYEKLNSQIIHPITVRSSVCKLAHGFLGQPPLAQSLAVATQQYSPSNAAFRRNWKDSTVGCPFEAPPPRTISLLTISVKYTKGKNSPNSCCHEAQMPDKVTRPEGAQEGSAFLPPTHSARRHDRRQNHSQCVS